MSRERVFSEELLSVYRLMLKRGFCDSLAVSHTSLVTGDGMITGCTAELQDILIECSASWSKINIADIIYI